MGHLTNPIGFRIGRTKAWKSLWAASSQAYAIHCNAINRVSSYFKLFFGHVFVSKLKDNGLVYSHAWTRYRLNKLVITVYLYSGNLVKMQKRRYVKFLAYVNSRRKKLKKFNKKV